MDSWIAPRLTDGLGNRLFQYAHGQACATKYNKPLVWFVPRISPSVHSDCSVLMRMFPHVPIVELANSWDTYTEQPYTLWSYKPTQLETYNNPRIVLEGFYQSERYFENESIQPNWANVFSQTKLASLQQLLKDPGQAWFIHVRLGDYMKLPHHQINVKAYYEKACASIPRNVEVLVFSDSPQIAESLLPPLPGRKVTYVDDLSAAESLYVMSLVGGGAICGNSTFSWWGAYFSCAKSMKKPIFFPKPWSSMNICDDDIYPSWGTVLQV